MILNKPKLFISYFENLIEHRLGPFFTISPDGSGAVIGQDWQAFEVQTENLRFGRIIVPTRYYSITA